MIELLGEAHEHGRDLGVLRVLRLRRAEERLQGEEGRLDCEDWRPSRAQGIKADGTLGMSASSARAMRWTYSLRADIRMPDAGFELHGRRPKGIFDGDANVDGVLAALVRRVWWPWEGGLEVCKVIAAGTCGFDARVAVLLDIGELFRDAAHAVACHVEAGGKDETRVGSALVLARACLFFLDTRQ